MGVGWAVCMPLLNTAVFSVIFTQVAPIQTPVPYPLFVYCGLMAWSYFSQSLRFAVNSLTSNVTLVTKVYFPREILPLSAVAVCTVDFAVASVVLGAMMVYYRNEIPGVTLMVLWVPVIVAVQMIFTVAIGLLVSMANLFYRDVKYIFEVVITAWMFGTSALYPAERAEGFAKDLIAWNPMTPIIDSYRNVILLGQPPSEALTWAALLSVVALAGSWLLFHRAESRFAESI
jgi:ABC-type polysaccharide/polyol phosphate export permease